jgi:hypothetical protein
MLYVIGALVGQVEVNNRVFAAADFEFVSYSASHYVTRCKLA